MKQVKVFDRLTSLVAEHHRLAKRMEFNSLENSLCFNLCMPAHFQSDADINEYVSKTEARATKLKELETEYNQLRALIDPLPREIWMLLKDLPLPASYKVNVGDTEIVTVSMSNKTDDHYNLPSLTINGTRVYRPTSSDK